MTIALGSAPADPPSGHPTHPLAACRRRRQHVTRSHWGPLSRTRLRAIRLIRFTACRRRRQHVTGGRRVLSEAKK